MDIKKKKVIESFTLPELKKPIMYSLAFFLPFISCAIIYALFDVWPFGDRTVLVMDLNGQYVDFFAYWHKVLTGEASIFYSFSKEMGGNVYGLFAYYLSSPFFLLAAFFPNSAMAEGIALITMLKIGTSGITCAIFLSKVFKKQDLAVVLFSCAYALMTYQMHYQMCVMWLDGAIWLPLILLGIERIIENKPGSLFLTTYTLSMLSNYYTAYMNTLFVIIYFFARYFIITDAFDKRDFIKKIIKMLCLGLCGILLSMVVIFPSFLDIFNGKMSSSSHVPEGFFNVGITNILRRLFIGQYDTITNSGVPNIFCGMLCGLMTVTFFFNSNISRRKRIITGAVFMVLIISFFIKEIDMAWHIFQYPSWYPYRYAYVFCLFAVMTALNGFYDLKISLTKKIPISFDIFIVLLISVLIFGQNMITNKPLAIASIILAFLYIVALIVFFRGKTKVRNVICVLLVIFTCAELIVNGLVTIEGLNKEHKYKKTSEIETYVNIIEPNVEFIKTNDDGLYRMEKTFLRTDNDSMTFGYNGLTHYSSTFNANILNFNKKMGMRQEWFASRYMGSTIITDSLLGVKYIISSGTVADDYVELKNDEDVQIFQNPYALPFGFAVEKSAVSAPSYGNSYLMNQDLFAKSLLGNSYVTKMDAKVNNSQTIEFVAENEGIYYLSLPAKYNGDIVVNYNGKTVTNPYAKHIQKIFCLGKLYNGETISVTLPKINDINGAEIHYIDTNSFYNDISQKNKDSALLVTEYGDTYIKGKVNIREGEMLFTTIPYENGWTAYVDGEKYEVISAQNTFCAVLIPEGEHVIELRYRTPGFMVGLCISLSTFICILAFAYLKKRKSAKM